MARLLLLIGALCAAWALGYNVCQEPKFEFAKRRAGNGTFTAAYSDHLEVAIEYTPLTTVQYLSMAILTQDTPPKVFCAIRNLLLDDNETANYVRTSTDERPRALVNVVAWTGAPIGTKFCSIQFKFHISAEPLTTGCVPFWELPQFGRVKVHDIILGPNEWDGNLTNVPQNDSFFDDEVESMKLKAAERRFAALETEEESLLNTFAHVTFAGAAAKQPRNVAVNYAYPNVECPLDMGWPCAVHNSLTMLRERHSWADGVVEEGDLDVSSLQSLNEVVEGDEVRRATSAEQVYNKMFFTRNESYPVFSSTDTITAANESCLRAIEKLREGCDVEIASGHKVAAVIAMEELEGNMCRVVVRQDVRQGELGGLMDETIMWDLGSNEFIGGAGFHAWRANLLVYECPRTEQ